MLNPDIFKTQLALLSINFSFNLDGEAGVIYQNMIYKVLKNEVDDHDMIEITDRIIKQTSIAEWNSLYGYGGKPGVADWIAAYVPKWERVPQHRLDENGKKTGMFDWVYQKPKTKQLITSQL